MCYPARKELQASRRAVSCSLFIRKLLWLQLCSLYLYLLGQWLVLVLQIMTCTRWSIHMAMVKLNQVGYLIVIHIPVRNLLCPLYLHLTTQATELMIILKVSMCQWKFMEILTIPILYKKATRAILSVLLCSKTPIRQIRQARKKRLPIMKCLAMSLTGISGSMAHTTICEV